GAGIGLHAHEGEDEVYIVVKGTGKVNDAGTVTELNVGDTVLTGQGNSHSVECVGDETLEIIALVVTY
ncbi:MAG: cupin domain-containing protein, partial [Victivallales bacterium]|nr:cupin domain-containing protein [Victivallales bacterium]